MRLLSLIILISLASLFIVTCSQPSDHYLSNKLPDVVTYNDHIQLILENNCVRCHGGSTTRSIDMSSYGNILDLSGNDISSNIFVPGNPQSKILKLRLNPETGGMYDYLNSAIEYDYIYQWIVVDSLREDS